MSCTMFLSAKCKDSVTALLLSIVVLLLPAISYIAIGGSTWVSTILPSAGIGMQNNYLYQLINFNFLHVGDLSLWTPHVILVSAAIEIPVFLLLAVRSYCKHRIAWFEWKSRFIKRYVPERLTISIMMSLNSWICKTQSHMGPSQSSHIPALALWIGFQISCIPPRKIFSPFQARWPYFQAERICGRIYGRENEINKNLPDDSKRKSRCTAANTYVLIQLRRFWSTFKTAIPLCPQTAVNPWD